MVLSIKDLRVGFAQSDSVTPVVNGVSIDVASGETVAIVGESGSGKSVTALSSVALLPGTARVSGSITYHGQELLGANEKTLRRIRGNDISFIFQEPMTSLNPLQTLQQQLAESLELHQNIKGDAVTLRIIDLLNKVGISDPDIRMKSYPHQLSGGQRQRVMIAMALANGPELLIADEPTTALDVTIEAQILELLADLKRSEGLSLLFITHDLGVVRQIADRVYVMKQGEVVEHGSTKQIFENPQHHYTKTLLDAETIGQPCPVPENAQTLIETENLKIWFPIQRGFLRKTVGHVKAVNDANIRVREGETLGVVGESGSGKSTLALAIMRLIESENRISFMGHDIQDYGRKKMRPLRKDMQIVFQDPFGSLSPRMSIFEIITEGLTVHAQYSVAEQRKLVSDIMEETGLNPDTMHRYPHEFSGGQRQRISIARAMILRPKLVILDEPTSALDRTVQVQIVELLRDLQAKYQLGYLFISHDLSVVRAMAHQMLVMKDGNVVETGKTEDVFATPQHPYTQALLSAAFGHKLAGCNH